MTRPTWLDALVGAELRDALEVEVHFASEAPLTSGDLVLETDRGWLQLVSAVPDRVLRTMRTPSDVLLLGEWGDRTGVVLRTTRGVDVPFRVTRVDYAQRGPGTASNETVGAWILGEGAAMRLSMVLDTEDVLVGPPDLLWRHLAATARNERTLVLFGQR